jgi:hypothetical protein
MANAALPAAFQATRNLVDADAGTHFVLVTHRDWDHHGRIYNEGNHYKMCKELDVAARGPGDA